MGRVILTKRPRSTDLDRRAYLDEVVDLGFGLGRETVTPMTATTDLGPIAGAWIFLLFILPFFGALIYIIAGPKVAAQDVQMMAQADAATKAAAGVSTADEKPQQLKDAGTISAAEFDPLKAKALAT